MLLVDYFKSITNLEQIWRYFKQIPITIQNSLENKNYQSLQKAPEGFAKIMTELGGQSGKGSKHGASRATPGF